MRSPHEEQFRQDNQEGVPHPGGHLVSGGGPGRVISHQTFKLLSNFLLEPSIFLNLPSHHNIMIGQNNLNRTIFPGNVKAQLSKAENLLNSKLEIEKIHN